MNLPEPVTLDFLDAEVEDGSKEEVSEERRRAQSLLFPGASCSRYLTHVGCYCWASAQQQLHRDILPLICVHSPVRVHVTLFFGGVFSKIFDFVFFFFRSGDK